jgi:hypothetical protein
MASSLTRRASCPSPWLSLVCKIPISLLGLLETNTIGYKALYNVLQDFIAFLGTYAEDLDPRFTSADLYTDKSLFNAQGPVWPQSDRQAGRIPEKLRHLDTDGSWSKSGYHGWVYGYGLHLVNNRVGFPKLMQVETASVPETIVIDQQTERLLNDFRPATVTTDNSYTQALRIRQWAKRGVVLLTLQRHF